MANILPVIGWMFPAMLILGGLQMTTPGPMPGATEIM